MANEIFTIIKNSSKLNSPIDYQKFLGFIAVLVKGSKLEKMILIFSIFGKGIPCQDDANNKIPINIAATTTMTQLEVVVKPR